MSKEMASKPRRPRRDWESWQDLLARLEYLDPSGQVPEQLDDKGNWASSVTPCREDVRGFIASHCRSEAKVARRQRLALEALERRVASRQPLVGYTTI